MELLFQDENSVETAAAPAIDAAAESKARKKCRQQMAHLCAYKVASGSKLTPLYSFTPDTINTPTTLTTFEIESVKGGP